MKLCQQPFNVTRLAPAPPCVIRMHFPALLALGVAVDHGMLWTECGWRPEVYLSACALAFGH